DEGCAEGGPQERAASGLEVHRWPGVGCRKRATVARTGCASCGPVATRRANPRIATSLALNPPHAMAQNIKKVVLAYSGGLDTSTTLKCVQDQYHCEVVTFTADIGQGEEIEPARAKALKMGIKPENIFIEDLREEFVRDFVFPMFRANALYEGEYLLGTS